MLHLKCFNIPIQGQKVNLIVFTITTFLDKTIASLDLKPCVRVNTTGKVRIIPIKRRETHARQKKNREKTEETDRGVIASSSISRLLFYLFVATNLTKILVINKLS